MSIGPLGGIVGSLAGSPAAQARGSESTRAAQEASAQDRRVAVDNQATDAAGIGRTDGEGHEAHERDADGRLPWQMTARQAPDQTDDQADAPPPVKDPSGESGNSLDLSV